MKKFLLALLFVGNLFFASTADAEIETYTGEGKATMSEAETLEKVTERAKIYALRNATEKAGVYIRSQSRLRDLELVDDEVVMMTGGILKIINTNVEKVLVNDVIQIFVTVTVTVDSEDLQKEIDNFIARNPNRKISPTPVEKPAPPPPSVEKIEPPDPPQVPVEVVTPTPTDDRAVAKELLNLINVEREKNGKKIFTFNSVLTKSAKIRVKELTQKFSGIRPNGQDWWTVLPLSYQNEIAWEYRFIGYNSPQGVVDWFMNSDDAEQKKARKRLLNSDYREIGVAHFYNEDSKDKHYWILIFS